MFVRLALGLAPLVALPAPAADPPAPVRYELRLDSDLLMTVGGRKVPVTADTTIRYAWAADGPKRVLTVDGLDVTARQGGTVLLSAAMSAEAFDDRSGNQGTVKAADAPPPLKAMLADSFGPPVCTLTVDRDGTETAREVTDRPGAKGLIDNGMVANATLFHPPLPAGGVKPWTAARSVGMGEGGEAAGELTYTPQPGGKDGEVVVKVAGTLAKDRHEAGPKVIRNARYKVTGTQTYSPAKGGWVSGRLDLDVSFDLEVGGKPVGSAKGTMTVTLKTR
ncbi:MAG: hypothetical protein K2X87_24830 [Gemmataceae bacterium]|nr:hypothetical protein [Gemmataceae bacterium]